MASQQELADFLKSVERKAFKRMCYQVRDEEAALDIVQDSMMKLALSYGEKPAGELPLLFQRILNTTMLDWFRRKKTRQAVMVNFTEFAPAGEDVEEFDLLETLAAVNQIDAADSPEGQLDRQQLLQLLGAEIKKLPERQREAFLLRYWEEMDINETATAMRCSAGSVKTHCSRAVAALAKSLKALGIAVGR